MPLAAKYQGRESRNHVTLVWTVTFMFKVDCLDLGDLIVYLHQKCVAWLLTVAWLFGAFRVTHPPSLGFCRSMYMLAFLCELIFPSL